MDEWREWIRDLRQEGYSKQEIQQYLEEEGYDPDIVHEFWDEDDDAITDLSYISHDYMTIETMSHSLTQHRPEDYTNAVFNIFSSPEGTIKRSNMSVSGMIVFTLINLLGFILGATVFDSLLGLVFGSAGPVQLVIEGAGTAVIDLLPFLAGFLAMTVYLLIGSIIFGERGKKRKTMEAISYGSIGFLVLWIPVIGPLLGLITFYIWQQAIKQVHRPMSRTRALVLIGLPVLGYLAWLGDTALTGITALLG